MQFSKNNLLALFAFLGLTTAIVIPANLKGISQDGNSNSNPIAPPINMTDLPPTNPPFIVLPSTSTTSASDLPTLTRREQNNAKKGKRPTPRPCKYWKTRPCITQKEIDQGWHDKAGCFNEHLFLFGVGPNHCWEAGDDCVKPDCRY